MANNLHYPVPGGVLDPQHAHQRDVYLGTPENAGPSAAYRLAQQYIDHIVAGEFDKVPDLFTDDAVILPPLRRKPVVGKAEIIDFYRNVIGKIAPVTKAVSIVGAGSECFMELATRFDVEGEQRYVLSTIDHFTLAEDGRFNRMIVYLRP